MRRGLAAACLLAVAACGSSEPVRRRDDRWARSSIADQERAEKDQGEARRQEEERRRAARERLSRLELERAWAEVEEDWPAPTAIVIRGQPAAVRSETPREPRDPNRAAELAAAAKASEEVGPAWRRRTASSKWVKLTREQREHELERQELARQRAVYEAEKKENAARRAEEDRQAAERRHAEALAAAKQHADDRAEAARRERELEAVRAEERRREEADARARARDEELRQREDAARRKIEREDRLAEDAAEVVRRVDAHDSRATAADERIRQSARTATHHWLVGQIRAAREHPESGAVEPTQDEVQAVYDRTVLELRAKWLGRERIAEDADAKMREVR